MLKNIKNMNHIFFMIIFKDLKHDIYKNIMHMFMFMKCYLFLFAISLLSISIYLEIHYQSEIGNKIYTCYNFYASNNITNNEYSQLIKGQPTRLRITNGCDYPIWIQYSGNNFDKQNVKLNQNVFYDYNIPSDGLLSTTFWPKFGCNDDGTNCELDKIFPSIDSKFEASWGNTNCSQINPSLACMSHYIINQIDGYTLPFNVEVSGLGAGMNSCRSTECSRLSLSKCPKNENLSGHNKYPTFKNINLQVYSKENSKNIVGCMSPCNKLNYDYPYNHHKELNTHMCCSIDLDRIKNNTCTWENQCSTPEMCNNKNDPLSIIHTKYVKKMHRMCPDAYSYPYDNVNGLHTCTTKTKFNVIFCPPK